MANQEGRLSDSSPGKRLSISLPGRSATFQNRPLPLRTCSYPTSAQAMPMFVGLILMSGINRAAIFEAVIYLVSDSVRGMVKYVTIISLAVSGVIYALLR